MSVTRARIVILALAAVLVVSAAVPTGAPARKAPQQFFGAVWDAWMDPRINEDQRDWIFAHMAQNGIESVRVPFFWHWIQPKHNQSYQWWTADRLVLHAAKHGMTVMPIVMWSPKWARKYKHRLYSPPKSPSAYAAFLRVVIERYGPNGTFWALHPELTPQPIEYWQIWNEPHFDLQWYTPKKHDYAPGYGKLLKAAHTAIKEEDPNAKVVLAGLANYSWKYLDHLYKKGHIKGQFDIAAVHPYTPKAKGVFGIVKKFRTVLRKHHDRARQLWITETGLPASKHRSRSRSKLQTTDKGMASFLKAVYTKYVKRGSGVTRVYWYTGATTYRRGGIFNYAGLYQYLFKDSTKTFRARKALTAYRQVARKYEGCSKDQSGACAR